MNCNNINVLRVKEKARKSLVKSQLAACLLQNKKIISNIYCNAHRNENTLCNNCNRCNGNNYHAESNVIIKHFKNTLPINNTKKINLLVIRIDKFDNLCNARPCFECLTLMKKYNINKVYYSVDYNIIESEHVKHMISIHYTSYYTYVMFFKNSKICNKELLYNSILRNFKKSTIKNILMFIKYNLSIILPYYTIDIKNDFVIINDNIIINII